jgi:hypothetical protein
MTLLVDLDFDVWLGCYPFLGLLNNENKKAPPNGEASSILSKS